MKTTTKLFTILIILLLLQSCNQEDMENLEMPPRSVPADAKNEFMDNAKVGDSTATSECIIDPPTIPPIKK